MSRRPLVQQDAATPDQMPLVGDIDLTRLSHLLSFHIRMLSLAVNRAHDQAFAGTAVAGGIGKMTVLMLVAANPNISQTQLAEVLSKDRPAILRIIDHLARSGLLERRRMKLHRGRQGLFVTERGQVACAELMRIADAYNDSFFAVFSEAEKADFARLLRKLRRAHQSETLGVED